MDELLLGYLSGSFGYLSKTNIVLKVGPSRKAKTSKETRIRATKSNKDEWKT
jgi:hypothetical protein